MFTTPAVHTRFPYPPKGPVHTGDDISSEPPNPPPKSRGGTEAHCPEWDSSDWPDDTDCSRDASGLKMNKLLLVLEGPSRDEKEDILPTQILYGKP